MLFTVSTVLDTLPNIERFVRRNLAGGVDHMLIFMDGPDAQVEEWLDAHPHVTCIRAHGEWWPNVRPAKLIMRQRLNSNLGRALLAVIDPHGWSFHIDSDEVVQIDRAQLDALDDSVDVVWLEPLEAVSRPRWEGEVTHFKRFLNDFDLSLLTVLGVIEEPDNDAYFKGHVIGKSGLRPRLDLYHIIHRVVDVDDNLVKPFKAPWATVLHYDAQSGEEFVRKWRVKFAAGPKARSRPGRLQMSNALESLVAKKEIDADTAEKYLWRIYERTRMDDFETLRDLALLEEINPDEGSHVPELLDDDRRAALESMLRTLATSSKPVFDKSKPMNKVVRLVQDAAKQAGVPGPRVPEPRPRRQPAPAQANPRSDATTGPAAPAAPAPDERPRWRRAAGKVRRTLSR